MKVIFAAYISPADFFGDEKVVASMISALAGLSSDWVILVLVGLGMMIAGVIWLILDHCGF